MATKRKPAVAPAAPKDDLVEMPFVYAGRREAVGGGLLDAIIPINGGHLERERYFKAERRERLVGGIYVGAEISATHARFGQKVRYSLERWKDQDAIVRWEALDEEAKLHERMRKTEKDEKEEGEIEKVMRPLRRIWNDMRKRGDHAGCIALENAVGVALRRRVEE